MFENPSSNTQLRRMPWWTSPAGINFGFLMPIMLLIAWVGDSGYSGLTIRGIRFLTPYYILLGCEVLLVSGLSGWMGSHVKVGRSTGGSDRGEWEQPALIVAAFALIGYVVWFRDFLFNPILLMHTLSGAYRPDRTNIQLTIGVTSLSNVTPVFFSIYAYRVIALRVKVSRSMHVMSAVLAAFTLFRVYAWSERLAMIEVSVPFGLAGAIYLARMKSGVASIVSRTGPFLAIPLLILYFALFEYIRSWQSSTYNKHFGFWEFATGRLVSYYYTSLNNGAGVLATANWPTFKFENTLMWLHRAPFVGPMFSHAVDLQYQQLEEFLRKFGDVEFNNPSGIYGVFFDLGLPLGTVYFCIVGFCGGIVFRGYRSASLSGVLFYPLFFISFLEVFRMPYLGASRAFTWALGIAVALLLNSLTSRPAEHPTFRDKNERPVRGGSAMDTTL